MADNRTLVAQLDQFRKDALLDRLQSLSAMVGELEGVSFVTMRDIGEVFALDFSCEYDRSFVAETPARGMVDLVCPGCHEVIPDVELKLIAQQVREGEGPSKVKVKVETKARVHVCGQRAMALPTEPEVEGQTEAFEEADETDLTDDLP